LGRGLTRALVVALAAVAVVCATPAIARATTAPNVPWCGTDVAGADRPDTVTGKQVHVIYAWPSDGADRFGAISQGISTDLSAVSTWWQHQDYTRTIRFDLAGFPCAPGLGALDITDVHLSESAGSLAAVDGQTRLAHLRDDLVAAGFTNLAKKYLVYYDSPVPLALDACGVGYLNPTEGGQNGYAAVYIAASMESGPFTFGCGDIEDAGDRGGYSAMVAAHEMIHTFGALDTWDNPGPPHKCPDSPSHACDNGTDIMEPGNEQYWLDNVVLDYNHDDYYEHSGTWWDVQDSAWLRHLNEPALALDVTLGAGIASVTSDLPGVACAAGAPCHTTWDGGAGTAILLTASPAPGYTRVIWGAPCAGEGADCPLALNGNTTVSVTAVKSLALTGGAASVMRGRISAHVNLNRRPGSGELHVSCLGARLPVVSHTIKGTVATCVWSVPKAQRGKRETVKIDLVTDDGSELKRSFTVTASKR
jgi:hypothetical protein